MFRWRRLKDSSWIQGHRAWSALNAVYYPSYGNQPPPGTPGPETDPPYIDNEDPAPDEVGVLESDSIVFDVLDDNAGINLSTLNVTVEGVLAVIAGEIQSPYTGSIDSLGGYNYRVTLTPDTPFSYEQVVNVTVTAQDFAGNSVNQSWQYTVRESPTLENTHSLQVNGTDEYVDLPASADLIKALTEFTIGFWVKPLETWTAPVTKFFGLHLGGAALVAVRFETVPTAGAERQFRVWINGLTAFKRCTQTALDEDVWVHILVRYNGALTGGSKVDIWVNGSSASQSVSGTLSSSIGSHNGGNNFIGWNNNVALEALYNNVFFADRYFSDAEMLATRDEDGNPADLEDLSPIAWWRCGTGDTIDGTDDILDNTGNGHTGSSVNMDNTNKVADVP